jgi:hypothetical protein
MHDLVENSRGLIGTQSPEIGIRKDHVRTKFPDG